MTRLRRVAFGATLLILLPACGSRPHILGPTAANEGVVIYIHSQFRGSAQALAVDVSNLARVEGPCAKGDAESMTLSWDDCISSIRVMPGWGATLYKDRDFKGTAHEMSADEDDLSNVRGSCDGSFNDCISSMKVYRR